MDNLPDSLERESMSKSDFNVVIMHGRGTAWKAVNRLIESAGYRPRVLMLEPGGGTIFDRLRDVVWDEIHCAVIVLTGDDAGTRGRRRARQNVVFELGYCYGAFDSLPDDAEYSAEDAVIVVEETGLESFADIHGLRTIRFRKGRIADIDDELRKHLDHAFDCAKDWYDLDD